MQIRLQFPLALLALIGAARPLSAQAAACGDSLMARADTAGAIAACEAVAIGPPESAEGRYQAGRLLLERYLAGATTDADRGRAEQYFRRAIQLEPDSARYVFGLAEIYRTRTLVFQRSQVDDLIDSALALARVYGSGDLADMQYRAGVVEWERYETLANRYRFISEAQTVDPYLMMNEWPNVLWLFDSQVRPLEQDLGAADRHAAEDHLRAALAADPRDVDAAGLLAVLMLEEKRGDEAVELGRQMIQAAPDTGRAWAVLGMALVRSMRWKEAAAVYDTALQRMTPAQREPYANLGPILKSVDQARFTSMTPAQQTQLYRLYWTVSQPLFLSDVNEVQLEFFARLTYVMYRWSDPFRRLPGYDSDRGRVFLRWGPPDIWASFGQDAQSQDNAVNSLESRRNTIVWVYKASQLRFMFSMVPGFSRTTFAGDFRAFYNEVRDLFPVRFDNVPLVANMDTILVQFDQFRGEDTSSTELGVFSFMPIGRMARGAPTKQLNLETVALLRDGRMQTVQRDHRTEVIQSRDSLQIERRSYRFEVEPKEYLLRVEARLPDIERAARSTSDLLIRPYGTDSLAISDLLVAHRVAPRDSAFKRWTDFFINPSVGRFVPNDSVGLLWETYNLKPDSSGIAHYTVDVRITIHSLERKGFAARIFGGLGDAVGLTGKGDDEVALTYDRNVPAERGGRQVDYLMVQLQDAPLAEYAVTLRITDHTANKSVQTIRRIVVASTPLVRD
jgi:GWxTD domain-containing protein